MRTIQLKIPEIPEAKLNGKQTAGKNFWKIWVYLARLSSFVEILENAFCYSHLEVAENLKRMFWLNGKSTVIAVHSDDLSLSRSE